VRGKGISYDTGFRAGGHESRPDFDPAVVAAEMDVIARELSCTAVRISGSDAGRLTKAAELAAAQGLEVWLSPFPCELGGDSMLELFADCARQAESLRTAGARVVLLTGCELSLFAPGFLPGSNVFDRINGLLAQSPATQAAVARLPSTLNDFLLTAASAARRSFAGVVTYASGMWEPVDRAPFDLVAVDAYRDAANSATSLDSLRASAAHGKPLVVTEFGCCAYAGARDESEQVRYLRALTQIFEAERVDLAFWFTFAGYDRRRGPGRRRDLDMASYGAVTMLHEARPAGYRGLGWEPRQVFRALAEA
jgi:Glycosyl hydrolase catalytic core